MVAALLQRVHALARDCDAAGCFDTPDVLITAGGSAVFDLVSGALRPHLSRPVRGLLRSGCYLTHDDGFYRRLVQRVDHRLGCDGAGLQAALEVWAVVQSLPEPGLALLSVGKRDASADMGLPVTRVISRITLQARPQGHVRAGRQAGGPAPLQAQALARSSARPRSGGTRPWPVQSGAACCSAT